MFVWFFFLICFFFSLITQSNWVSNVWPTEMGVVENVGSATVLVDRSAPPSATDCLVCLLFSSFFSSNIDNLPGMYCIVCHVLLLCNDSYNYCR